MVVFVVRYGGLTMFNVKAVVREIEAEENLKIEHTPVLNVLIRLMLATLAALAAPHRLKMKISGTVTARSTSISGPNP